MPWHIDDANPDCSGFAVVKDDDGEVEGCHKTEAEAKKHLAALYASEEDSAEPQGETRTSHRRDDLLRASYPSVELRSETDGMPTMVGHFARFNEWTRIDSTFEGTFLERIAPGAFARTLKNNRDAIRVLFQHGRDPQVGDKPLGPIADVREDEDGAYFEVPLLDTSYNRDLLPGLRANLYGSSFRFSVPDDPNKDVWDMKPRKSPHNPDALPERTIREARLFEFGPVTFPAYAGATAGVRSITQADLDAAVAPHEMTEALPDAGPEAPPHSDEGTRETVAPTIEPEPPKEMTTVEYVTRDEKSARVRELVSEISALAIEYPGVLPDDAQVRWDAMTAEQDQLERDIAAWDSRQARLKDYANDPAKTVRGYEPPTVIRKQTEADIYDLGAVWKRAESPEHRDQLLRDNAMRATEQAVFPHPDADRADCQSQVAYLLDHKDSRDKELATRVLTTGNPVYRRAFNKLLATSSQMALSPEENRAVMAVGVDATGGYAVPVWFDPTIIHVGAWTNVNPYRAACRVETIVGTDTWRALTATAVTATRSLEAAAATDSSPTFASPSYEVTRVQSSVVYSIEMDQDRPDLASEMASLISEAKDNEEESIFSIGVGDALAPKVNPIGMFAAHGTAGRFRHKDSATDKTIAVGDLALVYNDVAIRFRRNAAWFMAGTTIQAFQAMETVGGRLFGSTLGYPAVGTIADNAYGNTGLRLLGKPIWEVASAPAVLTTDDSPIAAFGDPKTYVIVDRVGMSVELIPHFLDTATGMPTGQRVLYAVWRNTAKPLNVDGMSLLTVF